MSPNDDAPRPWANADRAKPRPRLAGFARASRAAPTDAERRLWRALKHLPVTGSHFRRQVVIAPFIADLACRRLKLVIEVDGGQHAENRRDEKRTAALEAKGWRVLRFWNDDVLNRIDGVMEAIAAEIEALERAGGGDVDGRVSSCATPTPGPSPQGGGGQMALGPSVGATAVRDAKAETKTPRQGPPSPLRGGVRGGGGAERSADGETSSILTDWNGAA